MAALAKHRGGATAAARSRCLPVAGPQQKKLDCWGKRLVGQARTRKLLFWAKVGLMGNELLTFAPNKMSETVYRNNNLVTLASMLWGEGRGKATGVG